MKLTTFKIRTTKPEKGNKYYTRKVSGGLNGAIKGKPTDACDVLSNCVGYANGRFAEIMGEFKYQFISNAELFYDKAIKYGLKVGQKPKVGAIMCWEGLGSRAGHVCIVEKVNNDTSVYTSESGYNSKAFWNATRKKRNGNWGQNSNYKFRGFIYNPIEFTFKYQGKFPKLRLGVFGWKRGDKNANVGLIQAFLNWCLDLNLAIDNSFGPATEKAVLQFQKKYGLKQDKKFGPACLKKAKTIEK